MPISNLIHCARSEAVSGMTFVTYPHIQKTAKPNKVLGASKANGLVGLAKIGLSYIYS